MDLSGLNVGQVIKNYKELCRLLNEPIKTGKSKQLQLKEFKRYFSYEKDKQNFIITEIYNKPIEKIDLRLSGNNNIYVEHIEKLLLDYLSKQKGYIVELPFKSLFYPLGIVNSNYLRISKEELKKQNEELTDYHINHFYQRTYQKFKEILFTSLKNLRKRRLIHYELVTMVSIIKKDENDNIINEIRDANEEEKKIILSIEKEVLNKMNLENINLVYLKFKQNEFYYEINRLLSERYNIEKCFELIRIIFNKPDIIDGLKKIELKEQKMLLNDKIVYTVNKQAKNNLKKNKQKVREYIDNYFGEPNELIMNSLFILDDKYIDLQYQLTDSLIKLSEDNAKYSIDKKIK